MIEFILSPNTLIAFFSLATLEIVLGVDNIIFISILTNRLPGEIRDQVRRLGLMFALVTRVMLLLSLTWVMALTAPLFTAFSQTISGRDLVLLLGGLFLLWKSSREIYLEVEAGEETDHVTETWSSAGAIKGAKRKLFWGAVIQIGILDIVFSLDSVITAVGLVDEISIMIAAVVAALGIMLFAAKPIGDFVHKHSSIKVLALSFLTTIGLVLIAEGMKVHVPKGYVYFAMAFSLGVELLNIRARAKRKPLLPKSR